MKALIVTILLVFAFFNSTALASDMVLMHTVTADGIGKSIGTVTINDSEYGLVLAPELIDLPAGIHGFHVHENPSCAPAEKNGEMTAAYSAGSHYDPANSGRHGPPWGSGHLGDLPVLHVDKSGKASVPVLAPRLTIDKVKGRALIIHAGGDNYSDQPKALGGGGARIACGIIK